MGDFSGSHQDVSLDMSSTCRVQSPKVVGRIGAVKRPIGDRTIPAAVIDVGWVNGLAAIRSLGRAGVRVLAVDHRPSALGFRSRYAEPFVCPDPRTDETRFVAFIRALDEVVVFPTHDEALNAIARHLGDLRVLAPFPAWDLLERVQSKRSQLEQAEAEGIDTPRTRFPDSAREARKTAEELGLPALVKPEHPVGFKQRFRRQAFRCDSLREVEDGYARAEEFAPMVQEFVPGGDDTLYTVGSYLARDGRPLGVFCGRKLRQTPRGIGTCRVGEALWVDEVVDAALRLLRAYGYFGLSQVEFKQDARDGRFKLMEINPRLWQWHGLAAACGVDLPRIAYADLVGDAPPDASMDGFGKRWAITLLPGERPALQRPPYVEAVFARDDPKPGFVHIARTLRSALP
jgi:predicted ATP-grasp superfamily ATP-dependent carboligase